MKRFLRNWLKYFIFAGFFSMFVNILQLTFPLYMLAIYDKVLASYSESTLISITILAVGALLVMALLEWVRSALLVRFSKEMDKDLSSDVFEKGIKGASALGTEKPDATLRDVNTLRNFFSGAAIFAFFDMPWTPLYLAIIFFLHPILGYVALGGIVTVFILGVISDRISRGPLSDANTIANGANEIFTAGLRNSEAVRSMGMLSALTARWSERNAMMVNLQTRASQRAGAIQSFTKGFRMFMQVAIYGVGAYLTLEGSATPGIMIAASIIMGRALQPVEMGMSSFRQTVDALGSYGRLNKLFSKPPEHHSMDLPVPKGELSVEGASLVIGDQAILRGVTFKLEPGESLGMIGHSAAGKSTLCRMIIGLWPSTGGKVRLDGADVFAWNQEHLGQFIGYLPQDVELFAGTVAENIARMGEVDSDQVVEAAKMAGAHEMILKLPKGYDTPIGQSGSILSGGQRQRVGLARALYGDPRLIVLDEPSSNLDEEGEAALITAMQSLKAKGVTTIVVSHKPSTVANVDKLVLLQQGQVVMFGPRDEVLQKLTGAKQQPAKPKAKPASPVSPIGTLKTTGNA